MEKEKSLYFRIKWNDREDHPPLSVYASKLGGIPYWPKELEEQYPVVLEGHEEGTGLDLLAQINFEQLPKVMDFPEKGILQFFIGGENYGMDGKHLFNQNAFRVIYHEDICTDESLLCPVSLLKPRHEGYEHGQYFWHFPFSGEFALIPGQEDDGDEEYENDHTCIGGRACFTQQDPRPGIREYQECDVLLFQLDSGDGVMWGDLGVGNFFISRENLRRRDFSRVMYYWDCT